jgi:choline-sulfatase
MAGHHGLWWKANYYEESIRVPWLISGPGIPRGIHREELAALVDLFPTLCALAGIAPPADLEGVDLTPLLSAEPVATPPRDHVICEYYGCAMLTQAFRSGVLGDSLHLIRTADHKYVSLLNLDDLFFDLEADPREFESQPDHPAGAALRERCRRDFDWDAALAKIDADRERMQPLLSGLKPSTPNQYRLADGRIFDAEGDLYGARWLPTDTHGMSGIIPQRYG